MRRVTGDLLFGWLAFAGPLVAYVVTLSPGVDFWDIGEMQTVPYVLGIAHPTGFPLFVLGGWLFAHVAVLGTPSWRLSLLCALASAGAAYALFVCVRDLVDDARVALAAAWAFAAGTVVWTHAVRAEVHDVATLAVAAALAAALRAGETRSPRTLALAGLFWGAGVATHPVAALALPSIAILAWPAISDAGAGARLRAAAAALAPLALYAYVPLRSAYVEAHGLDPARELGLAGGAIFDAGSPSTPRAFWRYVTGDVFHPAGAFAQALTPNGAARAFGFARDVAERECGLVLLAFALTGFVYLALVRRRAALGLGLVPLACAAFAANYAAESDAERYAMPGLWVLGACAGVGAWWVASAVVTTRPRWAGALAALALVAALVPGALVARGDVRYHAGVDDARALGPVVARYTADGSLLVATWNYATPLAYEAFVARSLGTRHIAFGWPHDFTGRYSAWRARYKHVYFVLAAGYDASTFARPLYATARWRLSEMRT